MLLVHIYYCVCVVLSSFPVGNWVKAVYWFPVWTYECVVRSDGGKLECYKQKPAGLTLTAAAV